MQGKRRESGMVSRGIEEEKAELMLRKGDVLQGAHNAAEGFDGGWTVGEGGETDKAFSATTKTDSRCRDHLAAVEQMIEEGPGVPSVRRATPYIRRILTAIDLQPHLAQTIQDERRGFFIVR